MNPKVDLLIEKYDKWQEELIILRRILLNSGLDEEVKWGSPCYTLQGKNICILYGFKEYCGLSFFKGALLHDSHQLLKKPGENTQSGRMLKFIHSKDILSIQDIVKEYILEAIQIELSGEKVEFKRLEDQEIPVEFQDKLQEREDIQSAFKALTPGRQRAYLMFFSASKQSQTRINRIEKYIPRILDGKGMQDCICGLSGKMPICDGSHKQLKTS